MHKTVYWWSPRQNIGKWFRSRILAVDWLKEHFDSWHPTDSDTIQWESGRKQYIYVVLTASWLESHVLRMGPIVAIVRGCCCQRHWVISISKRPAWQFGMRSCSGRFERCLLIMKSATVTSTWPQFIEAGVEGWVGRRHTDKDKHRTWLPSVRLPRQWALPFHFSFSLLYRNTAWRSTLHDRITIAYSLYVFSAISTTSLLLLTKILYESYNTAG